MRYLFISLFVCLIVFTPRLEAQSSISWVKSALGEIGDYPRGVAMDGTGNSFVTGYFQSPTLVFGSSFLYHSGGVWRDMFLVKYGSDGNVLWAKSTQSTGDELGMGVAVDSSGNSYVAGYYTGSLSFDTIALTHPSAADMFIVKYDPDGTVVWAKSAGGTGNDEAYGVAVDTSGNVYVVGYFRSPSIIIGDTTFTNQGMADICVVKYDVNGNVVWARAAGGGDLEVPYSVAVDKSGNSYVSGFFQSSTINFGTGNLTNSGVEDIFLVKYDPEGTALWAKKSGGVGVDIANSVAVDDSGNCYLSGYFASSFIVFGTNILSNAGVSDMFIAKYSTDGVAVWAHRAGGTGAEGQAFVSVDRYGTPYVTGSFSSSTLNLDTLSFTNVGGSDVYVVNYTHDGSVKWAKSAGDSGYAEASGISVGLAGEIVSVGTFTNPRIVFSDDTLTNSGETDVYVVKYKESPPALGSISGTVFNDFNSDGILDSSELGLSNWKIKLSGNQIDSTLTSSNGAFLFEGLPVGSYTVVEELKNGWVQTVPYSPESYSIVLSEGENNSTALIGNYQLGPALPGEYAPDSSTVLLMHFNEQGGNRVFDASGRGNHGVTKDGNNIIPGRSGYARNLFDTSNVINVDRENFKLMQFTVEAWIYVDSFVTDAAYWIVSNSHSGVDQGFWLGVVPNLGKNKLWFVVGSGVGSAANFFSNDSIVRKRWYHVAASYDGATARMYINGKLDTSSSWGNLSYENDNTYPLKIGFHNLNPWDGQRWGFCGIIDELRISDRARETSEFNIYGTQQLHMRKNWNLVSVPRTVTDYSKTALFPTSVSHAFAYEGVYVAYATLTNGTGYWLNFGSAEDVPITGLLRTTDTVSVASGWNIIGSISSPIVASSIVSIPPGISTSKFFRYTGIYQTTDTISPGAGYWIKVNQPGKLVLSTNGSTTATSNIRLNEVSEQPPSPPDATGVTKPELPSEYGLSQNYPNPFNPATEIRYSLPDQTQVRLVVFNMLGQEVAVLVDGELSAGYRSVSFDASRLPSGVYTYRLIAGEFNQSRKMLLVK